MTYVRWLPIHMRQFVETEIKAEKNDHLLDTSLKFPRINHSAFAK